MVAQGAQHASAKTQKHEQIMKTFSISQHIWRNAHDTMKSTNTLRQTHNATTYINTMYKAATLRHIVFLFIKDNKTWTRFRYEQARCESRQNRAAVWKTSGEGQTLLSPPLRIRHPEVDPLNEGGVECSRHYSCTCTNIPRRDPIQIYMCVYIDTTQHIRETLQTQNKTA